MTGGGRVDDDPVPLQRRPLIAEYDTSGTVLRRYAWGPATDEPAAWFLHPALHPEYPGQWRIPSIWPWARKRGIFSG